MGRAYEFRKERKFKRWGKMAKAFTRIGKDIVMAVKANGPDPSSNSRLRVVIQNAKGINMPKDRIDAAIKRASSKDEKNYEEVVYEGYGAHGVAVLVETSTDNIKRTVANVRSIFTRNEGSLGTSGMLNFVFERKGVFRINAGGMSLEELELELIDFGAEDLEEDEGEIIIYTAFVDFGGMQKALEEKGVHVISSDLQRFPLSYMDISPEQEEELTKLIDKMEEDEDVNVVYTNMRIREES
jgi:YebC/PmpR family DNA-binding regulatory protein